MNKNYFGNVGNVGNVCQPHMEGIKKYIIIGYRYPRYPTLPTLIQNIQKNEKLVQKSFFSDSEREEVYK